MEQANPMPKRKPKATRAPGAGRPRKYGEELETMTVKFPKSYMAMLRELGEIDGASINEVLIGIVRDSVQYRLRYGGK